MQRPAYSVMSDLEHQLRDTLLLMVGGAGKESGASGTTGASIWWCLLFYSLEGHYSI